MSLKLHGFRTISIHFYGLNKALIKIDKVSYNLLDFVTLEQLRSNDDVPIFLRRTNLNKLKQPYGKLRNNNNYPLKVTFSNATVKRW